MDHNWIDHVNWEGIADRFQTPGYIYHSDMLKKQWNEVRNNLPSFVSIFYSLKANPSLAVCKLLSSYGAKAEVSSMAELMAAVTAGVSPKEIIFLGPGKSDEELSQAIDLGIYAIVAESFPELYRIDAMSRTRGSVMSVVLRVNPDFQTKARSLTMGGKPKQFGIDEMQIKEGFAEITSLKHLDILGFHTYSRPD